MATKSPQVVRKLNQAAEMRAVWWRMRQLRGSGKRRADDAGEGNGQNVFTGYLSAGPEFEYLGWGERGPVYRYNLVARSDEAIWIASGCPIAPLRGEERGQCAARN